ncbi:MAG: membrane protein insertion efficiency factor YidD [Nannocystaceae bacterium]
MKHLAIALIRMYQVLLSPLLGPSCRFVPSCSQYAKECYQIHGFWRGSRLTAGRLCRCHPWNPGGVDVPPPKLPRQTCMGNGGPQPPRET